MFINYKLVVKGNINKYPGIRISINENDSEIGYMNILNLHDSFDFDNTLIELLDDNQKKFTITNTVFLFNLNVNERHRGNGLGKKIIEKSHIICEEMNVEYIVLIAESNNHIAKNLYKKYDYVILNSNDKFEIHCKKIKKG